jgi:hypothetical protein
MHYDLDAIRDRIALPDLYAEAGYTPRRAGSGFSGLCPFHEERTGSFSMRIHQGAWRARCFGCGWKGDVIDFYAAARGTDFKGAVQALAGRCGLAPRAEADTEWKRPVRKAPEADVWKKPWMPSLEVPTTAELEALAKLRGLSVGGLDAAARAGHLWMTDWPWIWDRETKRRTRRPDAVRSWMITDSARWVGQYRRLDGALYRIGSDQEGWRESKSWSTRNVSWPVGASEIGDRWRVVICEGSPDFLACFHFLDGLGMLGKVAVCGVLGASNTLAPMAMEHFRDREVRILMQADAPKNGRAPGMEGARRWQEQLSKAGAVVTVGSLYGLTMPSGARVKDLNDLALCTRGTVEEALPLFTEWGF